MTVPLVEWDGGWNPGCVCAECAQRAEPFRSNPEIQRFVEERSRLLSAQKPVEPEKKISAEEVRTIVLESLSHAALSKQEIVDGIRSEFENVPVGRIERAIEDLYCDRRISRRKNEDERFYRFYVGDINRR